VDASHRTEAERSSRSREPRLGSWQTGRFREALYAYEKVLELMPDFAGAY
jgi:hypothetical protein